MRDDDLRADHDECWNDELEAFTQTEGGSRTRRRRAADADGQVPLPGRPEFLSTLEAVEKHLVTDSLVFRYSPESDGLDGAEGTFSLCSFWYVEALTRAGRLDDAQLALEKMFTYANHVGLYAEQVSATGDQVGNFPQAFTHFALISAAINLDRALDKGKAHDLQELHSPAGTRRARHHHARGRTRTGRPCAATGPPVTWPLTWSSGSAGSTPRRAS